LYLHAKGHPKHPLPLAAAFEQLEKQNVTGKADVTHIDDRWIVQLAVLDRASHPGHVSLLFLGIDKDRAETVYGDINTLNLRTAKKTATEGGAVSAHVLIDLSSSVGLHGHHAVLEEVEGLSRSRLVPYLRWVIEKFVTFTDQNAEDADVKIAPNLNDDVVLDRPIHEQLTEAKLIAVDVFRRAKSSTIDKSLEYYEKTRLIEYRPISPAKGNIATRLINKILAENPSEEYPEVRVRIEETGGNERSVGVNRKDKQDALMAAFQLRTFVPDLDPPVEEATKQIAPQLIEMMRKALPKPKKK
jgi:hypothetical protein